MLVKHKSLLHICVLENKLRYTYRWYMCQNVPKFSWCQFRCQFQFDFLILNVECVRDLICCDQMLKQMQWCLHTFLFCIVGNSSVDHKYSEVGFDRRLVFCLSGKCNRCNTGKLYRMYLRKSGQDCYSISCLERLLAWETWPVLKDHYLLPGPAFQSKWTCHLRPRILRHFYGQWGGLVRQVLYL